jgi:uncharacterized protein (TIGR00290 family)
MTRPRLLLAWSSGKDSAWCLHLLRERGEYEIAGLLTTYNAQQDRVAMHGVRHALVQAQAAAAGVPLRRVDLSWPCSNQQYEDIMRRALREAVADGISHVAFGDLFLEDIRAYRERQLRGTGVTPVFPLWGEETGLLARRMINAKLRAIVVCVDTSKVPGHFGGRIFDAQFLDDLPAGVDPCGENGEFHTFCCAGPMFTGPIEVASGTTVERDGFAFTDLTPAAAP